LHDLAGAEWLESQGLEGWCTIPAYLNTEAVDYNLGRFPNVRMILNLRYSYAVDDGGQGTMPGPDDLRAFEEACGETMRLNPLAWGFVYCNEMNNPREWPKDHVLAPKYYVESYNRIWSRSPTKAKVIPGAIDPYNAGWGDWRVSWRYVLDNIIDCDGLAFHAYTHSRFYDPNAIFEHTPLTGVYYNLRVLESQLAIVPGRFQGKPKMITETNHWIKDNGEVGWEDASSWVDCAYKYFASQKVIGACLFRFNFDQWRISDKPMILDALRKVG